MSQVGHLWSLAYLVLVPILSTYATPINRQVGISENVFITVQNDTYGIEQRVCSIDSMTYGDGETIPTSSPCEHCICRPPGFACTIISCEYRPGCKAFKRSSQCCPEYQCECEKDGKIYQNGEKIMDSNNPCEICYCQGGEIICAVIDCYWRSDCQPRYIENRCCPLYDHCPPPQNPGPFVRPTIPTTTTASGFPWFNLSSAIYDVSSSTQESHVSPIFSSTPLTVGVVTEKAPVEEVHILTSSVDHDETLPAAPVSGSEENDKVQQEVHPVYPQIAKEPDLEDNLPQIPADNHQKVPEDQAAASPVEVTIGQNPAQEIVTVTGGVPDKEGETQDLIVPPVLQPETPTSFDLTQNNQPTGMGQTPDSEAHEALPEPLPPASVTSASPITSYPAAEDLFVSSAFPAPPLEITIMASPVQEIGVTHHVSAVLPEEIRVQDQADLQDKISQQISIIMSQEANADKLAATEISQSENIQVQDGVFRPTETLTEFGRPSATDSVIEILPEKTVTVESASIISSNSAEPDTVNETSIIPGVIPNLEQSNHPDSNLKQSSTLQPAEAQGHFESSEVPTLQPATPANHFISATANIMNRIRPTYTFAQVIKPTATADSVDLSSLQSALPTLPSSTEQGESEEGSAVNDAPSNPDAAKGTELPPVADETEATITTQVPDPSFSGTEPSIVNDASDDTTVHKETSGINEPIMSIDNAGVDDVIEASPVTEDHLSQNDPPSELNELPSPTNLPSEELSDEADSPTTQPPVPDVGQALPSVETPSPSPVSSIQTMLLPPHLPGEQEPISPTERPEEPKPSEADTPSVELQPPPVLNQESQQDEPFGETTTLTLPSADSSQNSQALSPEISITESGKVDQKPAVVLPPSIDQLGNNDPEMDSFLPTTQSSAFLSFEDETGSGELPSSSSTQEPELPLADTVVISSQSEIETSPNNDSPLSFVEPILHDKPQIVPAVELPTTTETRDTDFPEVTTTLPVVEEAPRQTEPLATAHNKNPLDEIQTKPTESKTPPTAVPSQPPLVEPANAPEVPLSVTPQGETIVWNINGDKLQEVVLLPDPSPVFPHDHPQQPEEMIQPQEEPLPASPEILSQVFEPQQEVNVIHDQPSIPLETVPAEDSIESTTLSSSIENGQVDKDSPSISTVVETVPITDSLNSPDKKVPGDKPSSAKAPPITQGILQSTQNLVKESELNGADDDTVEILASADAPATENDDETVEIDPGNYVKVAVEQTTTYKPAEIENSDGENVSQDEPELIHPDDQHADEYSEIIFTTTEFPVDQSEVVTSHVALSDKAAEVGEISQDSPPAQGSLVADITPTVEDSHAGEEENIVAKIQPEVTTTTSPLEEGPYNYNRETTTSSVVDIAKEEYESINQDEIPTLEDEPTQTTQNIIQSTPETPTEKTLNDEIEFTTNPSDVTEFTTEISTIRPYQKPQVPWRVFQTNLYAHIHPPTPAYINLPDTPTSSESKFRLDLSADEASYETDSHNSIESSEEKIINHPSQEIEVQSTIKPLLSSPSNKSGEDELVVFDEAHHSATHSPQDSATTLRATGLNRDDIQLSEFTTILPPLHAEKLLKSPKDTTLDPSILQDDLPQTTTSGNFRSGQLEQDSTTQTPSPASLDKVTLRSANPEDDFVPVPTGTILGYAAEYREEDLPEGITTLRGGVLRDAVEETTLPINVNFTNTNSPQSLGDDSPVFDEGKIRSSEEIEQQTSTIPTAEKLSELKAQALVDQVPSLRFDADTTTYSMISMDDPVEASTSGLDINDTDSTESSTPRLRDANEHMIIPERGIPPVEPVSPNFVTRSDDKFRLDLPDEDNWLHHTYDKISRQLSDLFLSMSKKPLQEPSSNTKRLSRSRQPRDLKGKESVEADVPFAETSLNSKNESKTFLKKTKKATTATQKPQGDKASPQRRRSLFPARSFLFF